MCCFIICVPPWQETVAVAQDGDGGGDFGTILRKWYAHFRAIFGPHNVEQSCCFNPKGDPEVKIFFRLKTMSTLTVHAFN